MGIVEKIEELKAMVEILMARIEKVEERLAEREVELSQHCGQ